MNVTDETLVIVRGINSDWFKENFKDMEIYFGGSNIGVPVRDAHYIGFYLQAPDSAITHMGIVRDIQRAEENGHRIATFYLDAIIKLPNPIYTDGHAIRKQEYWQLSSLGLSNDVMSMLKHCVSLIK